MPSTCMLGSSSWGRMSARLHPLFHSLRVFQSVDQMLCCSRLSRAALQSAQFCAFHTVYARLVGTGGGGAPSCAASRFFGSCGFARPP